MIVTQNAPSKTFFLEPGLHLLATPIGSSGDITLRGVHALSAADVLAAEDTRRLRKLMDIHGVALAGRPLIAYHDHNAQRAAERIKAYLEDRKSVVYASDAGTPMIADPGYRLAALTREIGAKVHQLPGPSAVITALLASGLPTDSFVFAGFSPAKAHARQKFFTQWASVPATLVFFETAPRLLDSLRNLREICGERQVAIARELTKRFEEIIRGETTEVIDLLTARESVKGEVVVLVDRGRAADRFEENLDPWISEELKTRSVKDVARIIAEQTGISRKTVYMRAVELSRRQADQ